MNKERRFIKIEALDPTGVTIDKSRRLNYYNIGYRNGETPIEEYLEEYPLGYEPMRKVRYLLTIGDYEYLVNRDGQIMDVVSGPRDIKIKADNTLLKPKQR